MTRFSTKEYSRPDESLSTSFRAVCNRLELDLRLIEDAWIDFERVTGKYALEGNMSSWYVVALYTTWKNSPGSYSGPRISLPRILNEARLQMSEFLQKAHKWLIMTNAHNALRLHLNRLLSCYSVTSRLFTFYCEKYSLVLLIPEPVTSIDTSVNKRKQRKRQCSGTELFHFVWLLFITAKATLSEFDGNSIGLLQLLLCSLQHAYGAVLTNNSLKLRLLNRDLSAHPRNFAHETVEEASVPLLVPHLFSNETDKFIDGFKSIQDNQWRDFLREMIARGVLKTESDSICSFLEPETFAHNLNRLDATYRNAILAKDLLDERQFLFSVCNDSCFNAFSSAQLKETLSRCRSSMAAHNSDSSPTASLATPSKSVSLRSRSDISKILVPISSSLTNFQSEIALVMGQEAPSLDMLKGVLDFVYENLKSSTCSPSILQNFEMCGAVYFKFLLSVVKYEKRRDPSCSLEGLLNNEEFHLSLICSSLEVLLFALKDKLEFPWSLGIVGIDAFEYFRIIELVIRAECNLTRETVRHFNALEEKIVSYHAWVSGSSLYRALEANHNKIPTLEVVSFSPLSEVEGTPRRCVAEVLSSPGQADHGIGLHSASSSANVVGVRTPFFSALNFFGDENRKIKLAMASRNLFSVPTDISVTKPSEAPLSNGVSLSDFRFLKALSSDQHQGRSHSAPSPLRVSEGGGGGSPSGNASAVGGATHPLAHSLSTSSVISISATAVSASTSRGGDGGSGRSPGKEEHVTTTAAAAVALCCTPPSKSRLTPLIFFMRKMYHVASFRLQSLCNFLKIGEIAKTKCWTCIQYIIVECFDLFEDHYLDQLIMCSVYAIGRSTNMNWSFNEILRWYRKQQYYETKTYRHALICKAKKTSDVTEDEDTEKDTKSSQNVEYGDLITYYNEVFLRRLNSFITRFIPSREAENPLELSPFPLIRSVKNFQPHRISDDIPVYVSPKKPSCCSPKKFTPLYCFENSPLKVSHCNGDESPLLGYSSAGVKRKAPPNTDELSMSSIICCTTPIKLSKLET